MKKSNTQYAISKKRIGFTLIELLVVISIIGILASLLLARFGTAEKAGRDARRKSDLNQYRTALENYAIKTNGLYPGSNVVWDASGPLLCNTLKTGGYLSACPQDPRQDGLTYFYRYQSSDPGVPPGATQYYLWADLENGGFWYVCASGKMGEQQTTFASTVCW